MSLQDKLYCSTTGCRMAYVVKEIIRALRSRFEAEGLELTIEQFFILNILDNEDGLILQDLAEIVDRDKSAVLRHLDGLEANHYITRVTDQEDKRRKRLLVTKRGLQTLAQARALDKELDRQIGEQVEQIEIDQFEQALSSMYDYLLSPNR